MFHTILISSLEVVEQMHKTGIVCTIGPASQKISTLRDMVKAGMNVARLNFSHGTHADHLKRIKTIRSLNRGTRNKLRILQDLEGFRVRIGTFDKSRIKKIELIEKQTVVLTNQEISSTHQTIPLDYNGPLTAISPRDTIFIDDGNISLMATKVTTKAVTCKVLAGGTLREHKGVNIPCAKFPFSGLGDKDRRDLEFGIANKVDWIAQSFVRNAKDITDIRDIVTKKNYSCKIIAKIENEDGIKNLDEIIDVADGLMVARGDLGVSLPIYEVPILQKMIINRCRQRLKIAITATQMLESMTTNFRPTRAEVSDVANAILDGTSYVMLSGETAIGKFPVETIGMMKNIIDFTEGFKAP